MWGSLLGKPKRKVKINEIGGWADQEPEEDFLLVNYNQRQEDGRKPAQTVPSAIFQICPLPPAVAERCSISIPLRLQSITVWLPTTARTVRKQNPTNANLSDLHLQDDIVNVLRNVLRSGKLKNCLSLRCQRTNLHGWSACWKLWQKCSGWDRDD